MGFWRSGTWGKHIPCREVLSCDQFRTELEGAGAWTIPGGWTVSAAQVPQRSSETSSPDPDRAVTERPSRDGFDILIIFAIYSLSGIFKIFKKNMSMCN